MSNCLNNLIPAITETEGVADAYKLPVTGADGLLDPSFFDPTTLPAPGSDTEVLFNDGGVVGTDESFRYDKITGILSIERDGTVFKNGAINTRSPDSSSLVYIETQARNTGPSTLTMGVDSQVVLLDETGVFTFNGNTIWHAGNQLYIGTTASSARTALELANGTWTPTLTLGANAAASTAPAAWMYTRIGNMVHFAGRITVDPTLALTNTIVEATLPIASNFSATSNACGNATSSNNAEQSYGYVDASIANDRLVINTSHSTTANRGWFVTGMYQII